jgi:hypothetical protein
VVGVSGDRTGDDRPGDGRTGDDGANDAPSAADGGTPVADAGGESTGAGGETGTETDSTDPTDAGLAGDVTTARIRRYLVYAALGGLALLAAVSVLQFYLNASSAISRWVAPEFRSAFQAAFNLAVLLLSLAAIYVLLDRIGE